MIFSPLTQSLISSYGWYDALLVISLVTLVMIPLAFTLRGTSKAVGEPDSGQTLGEALGEAMSHRGYVLLTAGFFVCGFHVAFIVVHFPAYVTDLGLAPHVGAYAISIVGLLKSSARSPGRHRPGFSKKMSLSVIYLLRAVASSRS